MSKRDRIKELRNIERIIVNAVSGMDSEDMIGSVRVHFDDETAAYLVTVIERGNLLRSQLTKAGR